MWVFLKNEKDFKKKPSITIGPVQKSPKFNLIHFRRFFNQIENWEEISNTISLNFSKENTMSSLEIFHQDKSLLRKKKMKVQNAEMIPFTQVRILWQRLHSHWEWYLLLRLEKGKLDASFQQTLTLDCRNGLKKRNKPGSKYWM